MRYKIIIYIFLRFQEPVWRCGQRPAVSYGWRRLPLSWRLLATHSYWPPLLHAGLILHLVRVPIRFRLNLSQKCGNLVRGRKMLEGDRGTLTVIPCNTIPCSPLYKPNYTPASYALKSLLYVHDTDLSLCLNARLWERNCIYSCK